MLLRKHALTKCHTHISIYHVLSSFLSAFDDVKVIIKWQDNFKSFHVFFPGDHHAEDYIPPFCDSLLLCCFRQEWWEPKQTVQGKEFDEEGWTKYGAVKVWSAVLVKTLFFKPLKEITVKFLHHNVQCNVFHNMAQKRNTEIFKL